MTNSPSPQAVSPRVLEAIAHNLCSLHDFDVEFVMAQEKFARAVIAEYRRASPADGVVVPLTEDELAQLPIDLAPRDGTFLRLRVRYEPHSGKSWTPLEDAELSWTIGFNNLENTGEDRWQVVGWDWSQDFLLEAVDAEVMGWLPFHGELAASPALAATSGGGEALARLTRAVAYHDEQSAAGVKCDYVSVLAKDISVALSAQTAPAGGGDVQTLRVLLDNLVIAQRLSRELREQATDQARSYLYNTRATPPSADADKLVIAREALEAARAALHDHYVNWDGEPEDAAPLQLARDECDQALARLSTMEAK
jgi:hypothetical protein